MKFFINGFLVNVTKSADLVTFTEETVNGKLHFLCSAISRKVSCFDIASCIQSLASEAATKCSIKNLLSKFRKIHRKTSVLKSLF